MNLILIVLLVVCLPDSNQGFTTPHFKVAVTHRTALSLGCVSLRQNAGAGNVLSTLIAGNSNGKQRSIKNVIQKIRNIVESARNMDVKSGDVGASSNSGIKSSNGRREMRAAGSKRGNADSIEHVYQTIGSMKAKVAVEKIRLLPAFVLANLLSLFKFRPAWASGKEHSYYCYYNCCSMSVFCLCCTKGAYDKIR